MRNTQDRPKMGELYICIKSGGAYAEDDIIELVSDDESSMPYFRHAGRDDIFCAFLSNIRKLEPATEPANVGDTVAVLVDDDTRGIRKGDVLTIDSTCPGSSYCAIAIRYGENKEIHLYPHMYAIIKRAEPKPVEQPAPVRYSFSDYVAGRIIVAFRDRDEYDAFAKACKASNVRWTETAEMTNHIPESYNKGYWSEKHARYVEVVSVVMAPKGTPKVNFYDLTDSVNPATTPLDDFKAGKFWLSIGNDEWPEFARWCRENKASWCDGEEIRRDVRLRESNPVKVCRRECDRLYLHFTSCEAAGETVAYETVFPQKPKGPEIKITFEDGKIQVDRRISDNLRQFNEYTIHGDEIERAIRALEKSFGLNTSIYDQLRQAEVQAKKFCAIRDAVRGIGQ